MKNHTGDHRYLSPVVIQRFAGRADPSLPGFYGGAQVWIMEDDGSHLRVVRSSVAGHLDHPTLSPDLEHVLYSSSTIRRNTWPPLRPLIRENLYTRERSIVRSVTKAPFTTTPYRR